MPWSVAGVQIMPDPWDHMAQWLLTAIIRAAVEDLQAWRRRRGNRAQRRRSGYRILGSERGRLAGGESVDAPKTECPGKLSPGSFHQLDFA
jgi:hypothetical protein